MDTPTKVRRARRGRKCKCNCEVCKTSCQGRILSARTKKAPLTQSALEGLSPERKYSINQLRIHTKCRSYYKQLNGRNADKKWKPDEELKRRAEQELKAEGKWL